MRWPAMIALVALACDGRGENASDAGAPAAAPAAASGSPTAIRTVVLPASASADPPRADAPDATIAIPPPARSVRLVAAGKPPLGALRYKFAAGSQEIALIGTLEARAVVAVTPASDGAAELGYRSPPAQPTALLFGPWKLGVGTRGEIASIRIGWTPRDLGEVEIAQRVAALAPLLLPEEAVGVGAEWVVRYELPAGAEEQTYRVLELAEGRATLDIQVAQKPAAGSEGRTLRGEGAAELRLDLPVPGYQLVYVPADQPRGHVTAPLVSLRVVAVPPAAREALP